MAVTEVRLIENGLSGVAQGKTRLDVRNSYSATYFVKCSDPLDGAKVIINYFRLTSGVPFIGDSYNFGNDRDASSVCRKITPSRIDKSGGMWNVRVEFEPLEGEDQEDNTDAEGNQQSDPLLWHDEINISYTQLSIPVELATFRGSNRNGVNGAAVRFIDIGKTTIPMNSALVPFEPGIEMEIDIKVVRITKNVAEYDGNQANEFIGCVNSDQVVINKQAYGYKDSWGPLTAKIKNIDGTFQIANKIPYWKQTVEVHITPIGWRRLLVDRGLERRLAEGDIIEYDANGTAIQVSPSDQVASFPHRIAIKGPDGYPITSPCLLDGDGQPLDLRKPPVYLEYQTYFERAFAGFNW